MEDLKKILKLVLLSGNLKDTKPLSLLVVSKSGNGKTELITSFKKNTTGFVTDLSYMGLLKYLEDDKKLKHIIIPDFIKITEKKRSTTANLISMLNAVTEEGIGKIKVFNTEKDFSNRTIGLITATTKASFGQNKTQWENFGFVQRMIIVSYDYKDETIDTIFKSINSKEYLNDKKEKIEYADKIINSEEELFKQLNRFANKKFRSLKQLQTLCESHALLNKRNKVIQEDINEIIRLTKYMNLNYTKI